MMRQDGGSRRCLEGGFTMTELTVAVTIVLLVAALGSPVIGTWIEGSRDELTRREMESLADSSVRFYRDTGILPMVLSKLVDNNPATAGWEGPYLATDPNLGINTSEDATRDAWDNPYVVQAIDAYTVMLKSAGPDGTLQSVSTSLLGDDILLTYNVHEVAREITDSELAEINRAIERYNENLMRSMGALSTSYPTLLATLESTGLLSAPTGRYDLDGWGQAYVTGPTPVQYVLTTGTP